MRPIAARLAGLVLLLAAAPAAAQPAPLPPDFGAAVERVRAAFGVPGLAVVVVKDGRVVLAEGYGVRRLGTADSVDADTRFGIASNTKAFTATAVALLVEDGRIRWDDPVRRHLPGFALSDSTTTRLLTVRDLLTHRSGLGLGAGDLLWWPGTTHSRAEIVRRLRHVPLARPYASGYAYDNVLYTVAGQLIEAVSGRPWEAFVTERILRPLGMTRTAATRSEGYRGANVATPHAVVDGRLGPVAPYAYDNTNPAGGLVTTANDLARWLRVQLDSGRVAPDRRLFGDAITDALWRLETPMPVGRVPVARRAEQAQFRGYGLGFEVRDYRGRKLVTHTGGNPGFVSRVTLLPEKRLGIAVLLNSEAAGAYGVLTNVLLDHALGASGTDWLAAYSTGATPDADVPEPALDTPADPSRPPSRPLATYTGRYEDAWYGDVHVERAPPDRLRIRFAHTPALVGDLVPHAGDTFLARWDDRTLRADAFVTFTVERGRVTGATMRPASDDVDFSYDYADLRLVRR